MKLIHGEARNFGSYNSLVFDYTDSSLTLVYGPTGSGKSTFQDLPFWVLFGQTAKDGAADDIRSWTNTEEPTIGALTAQTADATIITVTRIRGAAHENDLYWTENSSNDKIRGKDATETQKLLSKRLGVGDDLYATAAYYSEFSPSAAFFLSPVKARRALFEKIASLDLPLRLAEKATEARKKVKSDISESSASLAKMTGKHSQLLAIVKRNDSALKEWEEARSDRVRDLQGRYDNFEFETSTKLASLQTQSDALEASRQRQLEDLTVKALALEGAIVHTDFDALIRNLQQNATCPTCSAVTGGNNALIQKHRDNKTKNDKLMDKLTHTIEQIERVSKEDNHYTPQIDRVKNSVNHYLDQLNTEIKSTNPFLAQAALLKSDLTGVYKDLKGEEARMEALSSKFSALTQIYDLSFDLRGELLKNAVSQVEQATNRYLETYFDAEIRVGFSIEGSDDLTTLIYKSGYECRYKQLSKGQRGLLKLCFGVAMMKAAANNAGVHFDSLFFDEPSDGCDETLKVKAYRLFEELSTEHSSIFIIDHASSFQSLFNKRYAVSMNSDLSTIELKDAS